MNNDRIDECVKKLTTMIDKFRKKYSDALNDAVLYAPEIQDCEWFYTFMDLDTALLDTCLELKYLGELNEKNGSKNLV